MPGLDPVRARARLVPFVFGLALLASAVFSQDAPRPAPKPSIAAHEAESGDPHEEIKRLMGRVERHLSEIDKLLLDAGAGASARGADTLAARALDESNGTAGLVRRSQDESRSVVRDIDRILELANHPHPPGGA